MTVQILRFKDGLDVICNVNELLHEFEISNPMVFEVRSTNLVLQQWLPLAVIKGESVTIHKDEILCTMDPNDEFAEYYTETIRKMKETVSKIKSSEVEEDRIKMMLDTLSELESSKAIKH